MTSAAAIDFWTIAIGVLCNTSCALLGCYLVLRRMSLLGDAIAHAVLPGIVIAFIIFESRAPVPMFLGAMGIGVLTAFLTQTVHRFARVAQDTSMGVVFTSLFALGVVLISVVPGLTHVDLDPACVFEGSIEYEAFYVGEYFGVSMPRSVPMLAGVLLLNLLFIGVMWKELKLATFDPALATSLGFSSTFLFYALMAMVAGTTVASFWAVGSILVIAMLIVPGATAQLLTDRFGVMLILAVVIAIISSAGGYLIADRLDTSAAGMMAVVAGAQYFLAMIFAPRYGVLLRRLRHLALAVRIAGEDMLAELYRREERESVPAATLAAGDLRTAGGGDRVSRLALWLLKWRGHLESAADGFRLSESGRALATNLVRSHRLWESYLARHVGIPPDHLHEPAMRMEHFVTPDIEKELLEGLEDAGTDPHGAPIPDPNR